MKQNGIEINDRTPWQKITLAGAVTGGSAKEFQTGDWRVERPLLTEEKCKQCLLCVPVCPDSSIPVRDKKRLGFDYGHCKGCGICAEVCPFGAITMEPEIK